jgi:NAD(P)-dependent dehydrogenase (short-subunit alcohol dehydrogenase family)
MSDQRRVLITGAGSGLGQALALRYAKAGDRVACVDLSTERSEVTRKTLAGSGHLALAADVGSDVAMEQLRDEINREWGGVDVLINNAGYAYRAEIGAIDMSAMREMFDTNVFGLVDITNRVVPLMKAQGLGDIINIASTSGMKGGAAGTPYGASKWAVRGISQCWQAELRPHGIRVTCVCPSEVQTNLGGGEAATTPTSSTPRTSRPLSWQHWRCRAARSGRNWPCSRTIPGKTSRE